ncbi:MAG: nitrogenase component 1 [Elusimicrobia bacterium]|nr:nitrogenase component 1 [Elusimicrobiota bacterium]
MPKAPGVRLNPPYLHGAFLAINAISDAFFLGDGPDCIRAKGEQIHGRHDLFSTLMSCKGEHRVHYTGLSVFNIAANLEGEIAAGLERIAQRSACGAVFMGSVPMCTIAGTDYERIVRQVFAGGFKPYFIVPPQIGLAGDWLDGYGAVLEALAKGMDLAGAAPRPENVAVVGYLMGRTEGDHRGNVRELERIFRALGLNPVSIWLSGGNYESLRAVRSAGAVISFGHGRKAAGIVAERLGVKHVSAELPFGLAATKRFVESLGREFGKEKEAATFIRAELGEVAPALEWAVPHAFLGRRFAYVNDPHYAAPFAEMIEELGGEISGMILLGGSRHLAEDARRALAARPRTVFEPMQNEIERDWLGLSRREADVLVATTMAVEFIKPRTSWLEFGYPSDYTHFLKDEPFLGFRGALGFCSRLANEVTKGFCLDWMTPQERQIKERV